MKPLSPAVEFDTALLHKYNQALPRYTSYPPATQLTPAFDPGAFERAIALGHREQTPLSLYCHIPFCDTPCYFCGCNTVITQRQEFAGVYVDYLSRHIRQVAARMDGDRPVVQVHWGGGTPNYLQPAQVERLWHVLTSHFQLATAAEVSIEINPRGITRDYLKHLRDLGFNRLSFGLQDFNPQVQAAVNRLQPEAMIFEVMDWARAVGFSSVNVDLIYGLPFQTLATFRDTLQKTIQLDPDRIAVFNFAYVPWLKPVQKRMPAAALPQAAEKLAIFQQAIAQLTHQGYQFIGMDHFAKPTDELAIAQQSGQLHRNFQGYTTQPESDLLGFGMTAISMLQDVYVQSQKRLQGFYHALDAHSLPIEKGLQLQPQDLIRRAVIKELMCQFQVSAPDLAAKYQINLGQDFNDYFAAELPRLEALEADGLLRRWSDGLEVTPTGRLLIRNIAAVFDTYLIHRPEPVFSQAI